MRQEFDLAPDGTRPTEAVLLARIVDGAGRPLRRGDVRSIAYCVEWMGTASDEGCGRLVAVEADEVLLDGFRVEGGWSEDAIGYNFRHCIQFEDHGLAPEVGRRFVVRYVIIDRADEISMICFQIRIVQHDRRRASSIDPEPDARATGFDPS